MINRSCGVRKNINSGLQTIVWEVLKTRLSAFTPCTMYNSSKFIGDEHAPIPSTKFDEDNIPAPFTAFPRATDTSHRRRYVFLALSRPSTPFYNIFTLFYPSPSILRGHVCSAFISSPMREHLSRCYI